MSLIALCLLLAALAPLPQGSTSPEAERGVQAKYSSPALGSSEPRTPAAAGEQSAAGQPASRPELDDLTRRIVSGHAQMDLPTRVTTSMREAARRLMQARDAGTRTQVLQREVLRDLDLALQQIDRMPSRTRQQPAAAGQQNAARRERAAAAEQAKVSAGRGNQPSAEERDTGGVAADPRLQTMLPDLRRRWGTLPQRHREELLQGYNEQSLPRYRRWVENYYRTLAQVPGEPTTRNAE